MRYVKEFEGLRGLLALWVLFGHAASAVDIHNRLFEAKFYNVQAVTVFVILSGFAITALIDKRPESYSYYIARRALRIFPVYLLYFVLSVLAARFALETWLAAPEGSMRAARIALAEDSLAYFPWHILAHLPALHGLVPPRILPSTDFAFLGQGWSISLEWQFYLVAPLLIAFLTGRMTAGRIAIVAILALVAAAILPKMPVGFLGRWLLDFGIGIGSFYLMKASDHALFSRDNIVRVFIVAFCLLVLTRSIGVLPYVVWLTVIALVLLSQKQAGPISAAFSRFFCSPPMLWVGNMAYSVYLSHMLVLIVVLRALQSAGVTAPYTQFALLSVFTLAITLVVSRLSYRFVELPFHNYGRRLGSGSASGEPRRQAASASQGS
ncbi:acyltransferase [Rhizobium sp. BK251]|uniref:acyltransferase family protein n=1 Tax=Rhizobium sp. BK251 TaxID=2512125 RepID=UPI00104FA88D|nr:acyltransferase [Rhizobium sp. BK251]TCL76157.1 peptidoglycan/LPS O-acetylase OafA/YrhL [Rhizobium sp. BK251]